MIRARKRHKWTKARPGDRGAPRSGARSTRARHRGPLHPMDPGQDGPDEVRPAGEMTRAPSKPACGRSPLPVRRR
jgi:hypothetical protein